VPKKLFRPPPDVVREWPEVFDDLYMSSMPVQYIHGVEITFDNGRVWSIDISEQLDFANEKEILDKLFSAFKDYQEEITTVNFQINIAKLKSDVLKSTKNILGDK
jgi:hypothetical protein